LAVLWLAVVIFAWLRTLHTLCFGINHQPHVGKGVHHCRHRAQLGPFGG
jgi:hypothetical protein